MHRRTSLTVGQFLLLAAIAAAQDPRGTILGRVTDSTGAVMPGVDVRATNTAKNVTASALTNDGGSYNIPFLIPGTYNIRAELSGFKKFAQDNVQVRVSETVELNFRMEIGELTETVTTTAESPVLDTAGSSLGQVVDQRRVLELPLFAGNPMELTLLTPGVANTTDMRAAESGF
jgi:Carboxypeptidase regulatory-like domain